MRSSIVSLAMSLYTVTVCCWPIRCARSVALVLGRHVPPRVVVNDHVGRRQVKAHAARLERNQKDRNLARLNCATILARLSLDEAPVSLRKAMSSLAKAYL